MRDQNIPNNARQTDRSKNKVEAESEAQSKTPTSLRQKTD